MDTTLTPGFSWRSLLRPLITARGYGALTHHLLGLPLGVAYFTWFVTGLAVGAGLAITLIGIPILTLVLASVRPLLAAERALANALLGANIAPAPLAPQGDGWFGRLKAYWTDTPTWRGLAYLLARFPVGLFTFIVAVVAYSVALGLIAAPLLAPLAGRARTRHLAARQRARGLRARPARPRRARRRRLDLRGHGRGVPRTRALGAR